MTQINAEKLIQAGTVKTANLGDAQVTAAKLATDAKQAALSEKFQRAWTEKTNFSAGSSSSIAFDATLFAAKQNAGIEGATDTEGVFLSAGNKCGIKLASTNNPVEDSNGRDVYGRLSRSDSSIGSVTFTNGQATIDGSGFTTSLAVDDLISAPDGKCYKVASVDSDIQATLDRNYEGVTTTVSQDKTNVTLNYYVDISGTETAHTMSSETIDLVFEEYWTLANLPDDALTLGFFWKDIIGAAQHNHDDRYYTKTEINSQVSGSSGAELIGVNGANLFAVANGDLQEVLESMNHYRIKQTLNISTQNIIPGLSHVPRQSSEVSLYFDGILQRNGVDFSVAGSTITWIPENAGFNLDVLDSIDVIYDAIALAS